MTEADLYYRLGEALIAWRIEVVVNKYTRRRHKALYQSRTSGEQRRHNKSKTYIVLVEIKPALKWLVA